MSRVRHGSRCPRNPVPVLPVMMASVERERASDVSRGGASCADAETSAASIPAHTASVELERASTVCLVGR